MTLYKVWVYAAPNNPYQPAKKQWRLHKAYYTLKAAQDYIDGKKKTDRVVKDYKVT